MFHGGSKLDHHVDTFLNFLPQFYCSSFSAFLPFPWERRQCSLSLFGNSCLVWYNKIRQASLSWIVFPLRCIRTGHQNYSHHCIYSAAQFSPNSSLFLVVIHGKRFGPCFCSQIGCSRLRKFTVVSSRGTAAHWMLSWRAFQLICEFGRVPPRWDFHTQT